MASDAISYDRKELRAITTSFKAMSDEAVDAAKRESSALAEFARSKIIETAGNTSNIGDDRVAQGSRVSKSSKIGELSFGFASQRFSGGGTTLSLWKGLEFGSKRYKQFPAPSGRYGRGSRGYFIYPTLRAIQPQIVQQWEEAFSKIVKEFN
jgi:hypothetical protein